MATNPPEASFIVPLPDGRVARVPLRVLEAHVDPSAHAHHGLGDPPPAMSDDAVPSPKPPSHPAPPIAGGDIEEMVSFSPSVSNGIENGEWHIEWELGACTYFDEAGNQLTGVKWHRHPLGTEMAELYRP